MANPFYVSPLGGLDVGQSVTNMANQWDKNELMDMQRTQFEQEQQDREAQATKQAKIKELGTAAMGGDLKASQQLWVEAPEYAAKIDEGLGIQSDQQAQQAGGWLEKYLTTPPEQRDAFLQSTAKQTPFSIDDDLMAMDPSQRDSYANMLAGRYLNDDQLAMLQGDNGSRTAGQKERAELIEQASSEDPVVAKSARIALGLDPRATGSAQQTIAEKGTAKEIAKVTEAIEGGKEQGKLMAQLKLQPQVKTAVQSASLAAQAAADAVAEEKSNSAAWNVYETGLGNLADSLGATEQAGMILGRLPALTASAQTADGAVAIMAPLLKQVFRSSGEGTFTDKDQEMLLAMVPTRKDLPEARKSKLEAIDAVIRAKLKQGQGDSQDSDVDPLGLGL
ncbi:MAG: hypothetical protein ABJG42_24780 [Vibrio splendidus]